METLNVTVIVPADATDFDHTGRLLVEMGMKIDSVNKMFGQFKGRIKPDRFKSIVDLDEVNFVLKG